MHELDVYVNKSSTQYLSGFKHPACILCKNFCLVSFAVLRGQVPDVVVSENAGTVDVVITREEPSSNTGSRFMYFTRPAGSGEGFGKSCTNLALRICLSSHL